MGSRTILVVDDNLLIRRLMVTILERRGFRCEQALDGAEAIERLRQDRWSGVVLDLMMPRADGFEVIRFLADERPDLLPRTIVVTADSMRWSHEGLDRVGRVVRKPFEIEELSEAADAVFGASGG